MRALAVHGLGGGFAYGVSMGGGELIGMYETSFAQATRRLNHPGIPDHTDRLSWMDDGVIRGGVNLVFGCPPCAGFSVAGSGLAQHDNPGHKINDGIRDWFQIVHNNQPELAVMESVPRTFFSPAGQALWMPLAQRWLPGYGLTLVTYDNQMVGVPQKRVRTLLWTMRGGCPKVWSPEWEYHGAKLTTVDAIGDLGQPVPGLFADEEYRGHVAKSVGDTAPEFVMRYVPWGGNARKTAELSFIWKELQRRGRQRPSFLWRRLHPQRPSPVLLADACERVAHYQGNETGAADSLRYLSGREVARLMGYPDSFRLTGHLRREVGPALCQAVSPRVGYWVGVEASRLLESDRPYRVADDPGPTGSGIAYLDLTAATAGSSRLLDH